MLLDNNSFYRSIDNGENWDLLDTTFISNDFLTSISYNKKGYLFRNTWGKGLCRSKEPMQKFFIQADFLPAINSVKSLFQGDTLEYDVTLRRKDDSTINLLGADVRIFNEINNDNLNFKTDSLGSFNYKFIVPMKLDTGEYSIKFFLSKFGYEYLDTIVDKIMIKQFVSVEEKSGKNEFVIYPNPVENNICISGILPIKQVEIFSLNGELFDVVQGNQTNELNIDLSYLSPGIYQIILQSTNNTIKRKIIKK